MGIGMPMAQARMPFMGVLLWVLRRDNAGGVGVVPGGGQVLAGAVLIRGVNEG